MWRIYTTGHWRKGILVHATTRMNLEGIVLHEISQPQKDKYCLVPLT